MQPAKSWPKVPLCVLFRRRRATDMNAQTFLTSRETRSTASSSSLLVPPAPSLSAGERIITIASLSIRIAEECIAEAFSQALRRETGHSVLLIHLQSAYAPVTLTD